MPIDRVGELPWWAYTMAVEGLAEERPWLGGPVFMIEPPEPAEEPRPPVSRSDDPGVFVGVRPEEVER